MMRDSVFLFKIVSCLASVHSPSVITISIQHLKRGVDDGSIAVRGYLKMTALIGHDVIDGAPAARF
ncbi:MAG: hypothetical protein ABFD25_00510 [Clostridiaceae bacterium]